MSRLRRSLLGVIPHLEAANARWAIVGGLAVGARAVARGHARGRDLVAELETWIARGRQPHR